MAAQRVCCIAELMHQILHNLGDDADLRSLIAVSQVNHMWHDAATDVLWRCPPSRALHYLRTRCSVERRAFYAAKIRQLGPHAHFAVLNYVLGIPLPRLGRLGINSGILRRNAAGMEHLHRLLPPGQLTRFEISDCIALWPLVFDALDLVAQLCPQLRELRLAGNNTNPCQVRHAAPDMLPRFLSFFAACPASLTCVELGGAVDLLVSTYKSRTASVREIDAAATSAAATSFPREVSVSPLILRLAHLAQLESLELPDTVMGDATIVGVKLVLAAEGGRSSSTHLVAPFTNLRKLRVCLAPAAVRELVSLVPHIVHLCIEFSRAPAAALSTSTQSRRDKPVRVTAADLLPLAQLRNLRGLGIFAGVDSDRGRRGGYWRGPWVRVKRLDEDDFTALASALAPSMQHFEMGEGFLPPQALAIMAALNFRILECVNLVGEYDMSSWLAANYSGVGFPQLRQLRLTNIALSERYVMHEV
jgi:hypothetical protein